MLTDEVRGSFKPVMSDESLTWAWMAIKDMAKAKDVHPRLEDLFQDEDYKEQLEDILNLDL